MKSRCAPLLLAIVLGLVACVSLSSGGAELSARLLGRAVLPADSFADGPACGARIELPAGVSWPARGQPVQGCSALLRDPEQDGVFWMLSDNGFGTIENSADYHLRVYRVRPDFERGGVRVLGFFELRDPDRHVPFVITQQFSEARVLTGADFDVESFRRAPDGSFWFGDEFGPFLLHTDATGRLLEAPIALPDLDAPGRELRSPQNPGYEEASALRFLGALHARGRARSPDAPAPIASPWELMLADGDPATVVPSRAAAARVSSEIFDVASIQAAGFDVVPWTVNEAARMQQLLALGVRGMISDRPDVLFAAVRDFDADGDGVAGDYLSGDGAIDPARFDAQGHRGARDRRPENSLPAMEFALDHGMTTLEFDCVTSVDGVAMLAHERRLSPEKWRRVDGAEIPSGLRIDATESAVLRAEYIADGLCRGQGQENARALSPVAVAFARARSMPDPYSAVSLGELFDFVAFYAAFYRDGRGSTHAQASRRARCAARVRFNVETKVDPRDERAGSEAAVVRAARSVVDEIRARSLEARSVVQSFDFRALLAVQDLAPSVRIACLFGDFVALTGAGANLQGGAASPWLAGLPWPYRETFAALPPRVAQSGGFEGMALAADGASLLPMLEKPLAGAAPRSLELRRFDLASKRYTRERWAFVLDESARAIGDWTLGADGSAWLLERDDSQGRLDGYKRLVRARFGEGVLERRESIDLLRIDDPGGVTRPRSGSVGLGARFAMPFVAIEGLELLPDGRIVVANDNNYPFSVGRHAGSGRPDDTEICILRALR